MPAIFHLDDLEPVVDVCDGDAILMAQKLASELGLAVGISSGANFLAALKVQDALGGDAVVATVFADDNKKYLSTDLLRDEPVKSHYLSSRGYAEGIPHHQARVQCLLRCRRLRATVASLRKLVRWHLETGARRELAPPLVASHF